jgi:biotin carboxyl carrier protein
MKRYSVTVNGVVYDVAVEEIDGAAAPVAAAPVAAAPAPKAAPAAPKAAPKAAPVAGGKPVNAPMPGNILAVNVKVGDKVEKGAVLCVLEAMKMENEIMAPEAGTVAAVNVTKGATVQSGDVLVTLS